MNTVYCAKHIYLDNGEMLVNGAVAVCGGAIIDVGPRGRVRRSSDERVVNLDDMLLMPGFINMHSHLEEAPIRCYTKEPGESYATWSSKKYSRMRQLSDEQVRNGIRLCALEMVSQGITTVVDTTRTGFSAEVLAEEPIRSVIIVEVADEAFLEEGIERLDELIGRGAAFKYGIGPHALYSLPPRMHRKLIERTYDTGSLWACHAAESADELQAFCEQSGDFFFGLTRKRPWPAGGSLLSPVHYALTENLMPSRPILYHCNYVTSYEIAFLAAKQAFVIHCYKYNSDMEHKGFPIGIACNRGIRLCLGTEGMVSVGGTNLFDELFRIKMAYPQISAAEMLRWVTKNPAAALRASDRLGGIAPGKYADIIGVRFHYDEGDDLLEALLVSDPEVAFVMVDGEEVIIAS